MEAGQVGVWDPLGCYYLSQLLLLRPRSSHFDLRLPITGVGIVSWFLELESPPLPSFGAHSLPAYHDIMRMVVPGWWALAVASPAGLCVDC